MSRRTRFIDRLTQPAGTLPALVWAACILLILALTVIGFPKGALSTDILDLLPSSSADVRTGELAQAATRGIADRVIWAVREDASNPVSARTPDLSTKPDCKDPRASSRNGSNCSMQTV